MKAIIFLFFLILPFSMFGQITKQTRNAKPIIATAKTPSDIEYQTRLNNIDRQLTEFEKRRANLLTKYTSGYVEVRQVTAIIDQLQVEKKQLLEEGFDRAVDSMNQTELLKVIIRQNQRIIELLEQSALKQ